MRGKPHCHDWAPAHLRNYENLPVRSPGKGWLMLGGSTDLQKGLGYAGDLSGNTA